MCSIDDVFIDVYTTPTKDIKNEFKDYEFMMSWNVGISYEICYKYSKKYIIVVKQSSVSNYIYFYFHYLLNIRFEFNCRLKE